TSLHDLPGASELLTTAKPGQVMGSQVFTLPEINNGQDELILFMAPTLRTSPQGEDIVTASTTPYGYVLALVDIRKILMATLNQAPRNELIVTLSPTSHAGTAAPVYREFDGQ